MKKLQMIGIIALVLLFGLMLAGCDTVISPNADPSEVPETPQTPLNPGKPLGALPPAAAAAALAEELGEGATANGAKVIVTGEITMDFTVSAGVTLEIDEGGTIEAEKTITVASEATVYSRDGFNAQGTWILRAGAKIKFAGFPEITIPADTEVTVAERVRQKFSKRLSKLVRKQSHIMQQRYIHTVGIVS